MPKINETIVDYNGQIILCITKKEYMNSNFVLIMLKELILIRHGEAEHLVQNLTGGWSDTHLTPKGRIQAQKTASFLFSNLNFDTFQIYSSDLLRAFETAQIISSVIKKTSIITKDLRELSNGDAKDLTQVQAKTIYIPPTDPLIDWIPYPNGESWRMLSERIMLFMDTLNQTDSTHTIIVSHGNAICAIINWWLELDLSEMTQISYDIDPSSITRLRINDWGNKTISKLNQTLHLQTRNSNLTPNQENIN